MTATAKDIAVGWVVLEHYAEGINWLAKMAPEKVWDQGVAAIVNAADAAADQSPAGRQAAGQAALVKAVTDAGYGSMLTDPQQSHDAVAVVLAAVGKARSTP